jgi:hypothetical protein
MGDRVIGWHPHLRFQTQFCRILTTEDHGYSKNLYIGMECFQFRQESENNKNNPGYTVDPV